MNNEIISIIKETLFNSEFTSKDLNSPTKCKEMLAILLKESNE